MAQDTEKERWDPLMALQERGSIIHLVQCRPTEVQQQATQTSTAMNLLIATVSKCHLVI